MSNNTDDKLTIEELEKEIEEFKKEKERVRRILGKIGGHKNEKFHFSINIGFLFVVLCIFILGMLKKIGFIISVEIGVLLVSLKIAWMIHEQQKVNHFQFWILTSLEYRINEIYKKVSVLEKYISKSNNTAKE